MESPAQVTELLIAWRNGDDDALEKLAPLVESELHKLAIRYIRRESGEHVLQATALVNEAYLRLINWKSVSWSSRAHFFAVAAKMMRRVLVSHARDRNRLKRGNDPMLVSLTDADAAGEEPSLDVIALDTALDKLAAFDPRKSRIVEIRFFGGLSEEETADVLNVSVRTVQREWNLARAWLFRELTGRATSTDSASPRSP
jgi:RNA polymerase sigma-70 factor, ECF subfamily